MDKEFEEIKKNMRGIKSLLDENREDPFEEIERLEGMLSSGEITKEEYIQSIEEMEKHTNAIGELINKTRDAISRIEERE